MDKSLKDDMKVIRDALDTPEVWTNPGYDVIREVFRATDDDEAVYLALEQMQPQGQPSVLALLGPDIVDYLTTKAKKEYFS